MKTVFGALALVIAAPVAAQTAPAAQNPHAGHGKPSQVPSGHAGHSKMDHAKMMELCKDPKQAAAMKAHCEEMMKAHGKAAAPAAEKGAHTGHAH